MAEPDSGGCLEQIFRMLGGAMTLVVVVTAVMVLII